MHPLDASACYKCGMHPHVTSVGWRASMSASIRLMTGLSGRSIPSSCCKSQRGKKKIGPNRLRLWLAALFYHEMALISSQNSHRSSIKPAVTRAEDMLEKRLLAQETARRSGRGGTWMTSSDRSHCATAARLTRATACRPGPPDWQTAFHRSANGGPLPSVSPEPARREAAARPPSPPAASGAAPPDCRLLCTLNVPLPPLLLSPPTTGLASNPKDPSNAGEPAPVSLPEPSATTRRPGHGLQLQQSPWIIPTAAVSQHDAPPMSPASA